MGKFFAAVLLLPLGLVAIAPAPAPAGALLIAPPEGSSSGESSTAESIAAGANIVGKVADAGSAAGRGVGYAGNLLQGYASMAKDFSEVVNEDDVKSFSSELSETGVMKGLSFVGNAANVVETAADVSQSYNKGDAVGVMRAIDKGVGAAALGEIPGGSQLNDARIYLTYDLAVPAINNWIASQIDAYFDRQTQKMLESLPPPNRPQGLNTPHSTSPSQSTITGTSPSQSTITGPSQSTVTGSSPCGPPECETAMEARRPHLTPAPNAASRTVPQNQKQATVGTPNVSAPTARAQAPTVSVRSPTVRVATPTVRVPQVQVRIPQVQVRIPQVQPRVSDVRLKHDIVAIGELPSGLHLYRYRYLWSDTLYVGVMAQEVMTVDPDAVVRGNDGYLRVDYGRLGLRLTTWDRWLRQKAVSAAAVKEE